MLTSREELMCNVIGSRLGHQQVEFLSLVSILGEYNNWNKLLANVFTHLIFAVGRQHNPLYSLSSVL